MARVFTSGGIRDLDADLARADLLELTMERAGVEVARELSARFPASRVLVLAGGGANGGDALVAARHVLAAGHQVTVLALETRHDLARRMRSRLEPFAPVAELTAGALRGALQNADVVLDGLLGTGFTPPLRAPISDLVKLLGEANVPIVSIDLPSGLPSDMVEEDAVFVPADLILALVGLKPALLFANVGRKDGGEVKVLDLGVPPSLLGPHLRASTLEAGEVRALLPMRERGAHKGTAGKVWVLGGSPGFTGAPAMTALAALRSGSGLVNLYSRVEVAQRPVESMAHVVEDWAELQDKSRPDALAVGMGLGQEAREVARRALSWRLPTVIDADALQSDLAGLGHDEVVWTPHPGEAARLLGQQTRDVTRDPLGAAEELRRRYGGAVVLKGGPTVIATAAGLRVCPLGNPGMATGGMGDVLSGVIASLLGQGLGADDAAIAGVYLHALAGDMRARKYGYGLIATDVAHAIGEAWLELIHTKS